MRVQLTNREIITFCDQMYLVIHAGISALEGIAILRDDAETSEAKELLSGIYQELELTGNLTESLRSSGVFPAYMLNMVELGEQSGNLDEVLAALAAYYEREENFAKGIRHALTYPLIMIVIMFAVVIVLITKVMPIFANVFEQLGTSMNGFSAGVLQLGNILSQYAIAFAVILAVIICICLYFACTKGGRDRIRSFARRFGPTRRTAEKIACARFADGMAMALSAGLDMDRSLKLAGELVEHEELKKKIQECQKLTADGCGFTEAMAQTKIFSGMQARMLNVGFQTGAMDSVMARIASQYEEEADEKMQRTLSLLEPTLVAILSIIVGVILLSVMLPLAGIMTNIG